MKSYTPEEEKLRSEFISKAKIDFIAMVVIGFITIVFNIAPLFILLSLVLTHFINLCVSLFNKGYFVGKGNLELIKLDGKGFLFTKLMFYYGLMMFIFANISFMLIGISATLDLI